MMHYTDPVFWWQALQKQLEIDFKPEEPMAKLCLRSELTYIFKFLPDVFLQAWLFS